MFTFLDHPSECLVEIQAVQISQVFEDAAIALFEIMTDTTILKPEQHFPLGLESPERHLLLIDWLNRLILLHELERVFLCRFDVQVRQAETWKLSAVVRGERIKENHERRSQAKSATYGQLEWMESRQGHLVRFVVDI